MKTHIPATLRKALLAAIFATATYSVHAAVDVVNKSTGYAETTLGSDKSSTGYTDLTFSGTNSVLGTVDHWCHDYNTLDPTGHYHDRQGADTQITLATDERTGKYIAHSITSKQGKDTGTNLGDPNFHNHASTDEYGYSYSWSNGNINVNNEAVLEVTTFIDAHGTISVTGESRVTAGGKVTAGEVSINKASVTAGDVSVSRNELWLPGGDPYNSTGNITVEGNAVLEVSNIDAPATITVSGASRVTAGGKVAGGEITVTGASLTAGDITVSKNTILVPGGDPNKTTGKLNITGSDAVVTATGTVKAAGGVDVSNRAHLNAGNIDATVGGKSGYVRALPGENLKVARVASEKTQYIVDNGCTITLGNIGELVNVGTEEEPVMEMHGNGNYFGYGEDSNNIKADAIYVMGDIISDNNELAALGGSVDNRLEDSSYSAILVKGSITGNGNKLFVRELDSSGIWITADVSGDNNSLETKTSGDIHIAGTLGRSKGCDDGAAKGISITAGEDVTINQLSDNENLIIDALNGEAVVEEASEVSLINAQISADDSITFFSKGEDAKSTKVLTLAGGSVESDTGDIVSHQVIRANGTALTAEEGDINVYSLTYDPDNADYSGIQVTTRNLISEEDLKLDGTEEDSFDSFVTVTEDMRTTKGSISITNFTDKDTVNVGHDIDSADSITIKNVNGMLVGTEDEDGIEYEGSMTAKQDIEITDSIVEILGDQEATDGKISITKAGSDTRVAIDGDQKAGTTISTQGATLRVGILVEEEGADGKPVYSVEGGKQVAGDSINIAAASIVEVLDSQEATNGTISITDSTVTVGAKNADGEIVQKGNQAAKQNITIVDSTVNVLGDQNTEEGAIVISSTLGTGITSEVTVGGNQEAGNGISATNSQLTVGTAETVTDEATGVAHVVLTGGNQTADTGDIVVSTSTVTVLADQTATEGGIEIDKLSLVAVGTLDADGKALAGDQLAKQDIVVDSSTLTVLGDQASQEGSISVQALDDYSVVIVGGTQKAKKNISILGSKEFETPTTVLVGEDQIAEEGKIAITDAVVVVNGKVVALGDGSDGTGIVALAGATYEVGISLEAKELNIGTIDNPSEVTINVDSLDTDGETQLATVLDVDKLVIADGNTLHTGNVKMDAADVAIHGVVEVGVKDYEDPANDIAADWDVTGSHEISGENAHLMANGNIKIVAAEEGDTIRISEGATVSATGNVTIQGLADDALAEVDGASVHSTGGDITLDNAELKNNNNNTDVTTMGGDIVLKDTVKISGTILNVLPTVEGDEGVINVAEDADVVLGNDTEHVFNGNLAGSGSITADGDDLSLYHANTEDFTGTIALHNGHSLITEDGAEDAFLGNVATTDDSHIQLLADGAGNTAKAISLSLTDGTTYDVLATTDGETGALVSDRITVSDGINANGARVNAHATPDMWGVKDGSRFTIVAGEVVTGFNEDVIYDQSGFARELQTRNMHLEHNAKGVDLVVSENYKAINTDNANVNAVREIIMPLDAAADHSPGVLAQSASNLDHILDALDYTRSGAAAKAGMQSVSAAANLIVPNMMMDASRHHLSTLRDHMATPVCTKDYKGKGNVWAAYSGGFDHVGGDANASSYTNSYHGAIIGGDYAINCKWAAGLSAGYEYAIGRTDATRANSHTITGDLYAVGRIGRYTHRFSMGLASHNTDVKRGTRIAAKGHAYDGLSQGDADGMSWNFGYQVSRSFAINQVSAITPYLTVDVALQRIDTLTEKGQGDASVRTDYDDFVQTDAALGVAYSHTFTSFNRQAGVFSVDLAVHGEFSEHRATAKNSFVGSPEDTWKTRGVKRAPLYGELGADVLVPFGRHISGSAGLNFEFSDDRTYIGGHAGVNYRF